MKWLRRGIEVMLSMELGCGNDDGLDAVLLTLCHDCVAVGKCKRHIAAWKWIANALYRDLVRWEMYFYDRCVTGGIQPRLGSHIA